MKFDNNSNKYGKYLGNTYLTTQYFCKVSLKKINYLMCFKIKETKTKRICI